MHRIRTTLSLVVLFVLVLGASSVGASPQRAPQARPLADALGSGFTYQGQLKRAGEPLTDDCNFKFSLWDSLSAGSQIGTTETRLSLPVTGGLFTIEDLDFGSSAFAGEARWLEIAVQCTGDPDYVPLAPRQPITPAPYALYAPEAGEAESALVADSATLADAALSAPWSGLTGVPAGFADDTDDVGSGTVTSVATGAGLTGGPITTSGTISLSTGGVTSSHIANGTIVAEDIFDGSALDEILDDDGAGSGLDADMLDGVHLTDLATATHAHSSLSASDGTPSNAVYADSEGHVGIGTMSPGSYMLSVNGPAKVSGLLTLPYIYNYGEMLTGLAPGNYRDIAIETITGPAFYLATTYNSYFSPNTKLRAWVWAEALNDAGPSFNQNKWWVRVENIGTEICSDYDYVEVIKFVAYQP
ncbi:MAG: hypothetical protein NTY23_07270 [Chloroflexi bacterium]|nr:hypothetical protein [Chloroflexota bacterium]